MPVDSSPPRSFFAALFHPWTFRMAWRDSRAQRGRLFLFALSIVAGIAALTAIHSLGAGVKRGIETQAKELLGADLAISSRQPLTPADLARLPNIAQQLARETTFPTMISFPHGGARMVQIRAIDGGFPFYGTMQSDPPDALETWQHRSGGILLQPALLDQFGVKPGDEIGIGNTRFKILGAVKKGAPRASRFSGFAPEAYIRAADLVATGLLSGNSMTMHHAYLKVHDTGSAKRLKSRIERKFPAQSWRLQTPEDRRENLERTLENFQHFLGIIALAALVLGAIGVASAVREHVARRVPVVGILRCLGCPANAAFAVFVLQAAMLGIIGALLGAAAGIAIELGVVAALREHLPVAIPVTPEWQVAARTTLAGFAVCCGFAFIPLLGVRNISPVVTLRQMQEGKVPKWQAALIFAGLAGLLLWLASVNGGGMKRAAAMTAGLAVAFALLASVAKWLIAATRHLRGSRWPFVLRLGVSHLHRPRNQTLTFLLSLGAGTFLLTTVWLARDLIRQKIDLTQHAESPNLYLIDVQPDQLSGVREVVHKHSLPVLESAPMVTMRVESIRGTPVREMKELPKWIARREFRSTWRKELSASEELTAGNWHTAAFPNGEPVPLSLEEEIARDMTVKIGDDITLDVQGVPIRARVTSFRKVDWSRFNLNFFMVFPPGVLEEAPGFHVVTTRAANAADSGKLQKSLAAEFPNVTAVDLASILETVRGILGKISMVVSLLAGFTVLAGLPVIAGTLANGRDARLRESVLLRALGASSRQIRTILLVEYASLGFLSALTGIVLAAAANAAFAVLVFEASPWPDPITLGIAVVATCGAAICGGLLLGRGICHQPPLATLRAD